MKTIFPNSAWVTTRKRMVLARGGLAPIALKVRYGVVIHPTHGPVLVDTGYTDHSLNAPGRGRILGLYARVLDPQLNASEQPDIVLAQLGYTPEDVRYLIVTHFHADHVSGLELFPNARFIADAQAWQAMNGRSGWRNYRHGLFPELLPTDFGNRLMPLDQFQMVPTMGGLPDGRDIFGDRSLISVPLPGHAEGHFGVLINSDPAPVLYAVDTQWLHSAITQNRPPGYPARAFADDFRAGQRSAALVAAHIQGGHETVLCHDPETNPWDFRPRANTT